MIAALAFWLALAAAAADPGTGTVQGQVRSEATGAPLPAAWVEIQGGGTSRVVPTDAAGRYVATRVPAGRRVLRAVHLGHEPLEVEIMVGDGARLHVDFSLRLRPVPISGVTARSRQNPTERDTASASLGALGIAGVRVMESAPGIVELGAGDGQRGPPGQAPVDPSDVLFVRGVASELKLVLLDGAPVYSPFHVGGLLDSFDAQILRDATLYLGGAPARYDGGLSYILDLSTRAGRSDRFHSSGAVDMMSARMTAEGGWGDRLRLLAGGRGVHAYGVEPLLRGSVPYAYREGIARADVGIADGYTLSVLGFTNREGISLDSLGNGSEAGWGNSALSVRLRGESERAESEITLAYGAFDATLPAVDARTFPTRGETERFRVAADFARDAGAAQLRYGASYDYLRLGQQVESRLVDPGWRTWQGQADGEAIGTYVEGAIQPHPRFRVRAGLRGNVFVADPGLRLSPRVSATWMLGERAALTAAGGRYHQYVRITSGLDGIRAGDAPDTLLLPTGLRVDQATHFNLALHQELDEGVRLGVEGFYKTFDGIAGPHSDRTQASGLDLWVRRDGGRVRGWLGYSLTWLWSMPAAEIASDQFAGRQLLNAGVMSTVGRWFDLEVRLAYGAGLPFSSIPLIPQDGSPDMPSGRVNDTGGSPLTLAGGGAGDAPLAPEYPADPYLRLDVGLSRAFLGEWGGRPFELTPYVKVLNSLDRRDALFYWSDNTADAEPRAIAALPLIPMVGLSWRF